MPSTISEVRIRLFVGMAMLIVAASACGSSESERAPATETGAAGLEAVLPADPVVDAGVTSAATSGGTITLNGVAYIFETVFCANDEDGLFNQGTGVGPDGTSFAAGIFAQTGDTTVEVILGQTDIFGSPSAGQPWYETNSFRDETLEVSVEGSRVFGSGQAIDLSAVAEEPSETLTVTFDGQCG